jgi:hypothetical protein
MIERDDSVLKSRGCDQTIDEKEKDKRLCKDGTTYIRRLNATEAWRALGSSCTYFRSYCIDSCDSLALKSPP